MGLTEPPPFPAPGTHTMTLKGEVIPTLLLCENIDQASTKGSGTSVFCHQYDSALVQAKIIFDLRPELGKVCPSGGNFKSKFGRECLQNDEIIPINCCRNCCTLHIGMTNVNMHIVFLTLYQALKCDMSYLGKLSNKKELFFNNIQDIKFGVIFKEIASLIFVFKISSNQMLVFLSCFF